MTTLGTVAPNGAVYFEGDINACRAFLRSAGLGVAGQDFRDKPIWKGWTNADETRGGLIDFHYGKHYAAWWPKPVNPVLT